MANLMAWGMAPEAVAVERGRSAKDAGRRPVPQQLLREIGPGDTLVVARLARLTRSLGDFASLVADAQGRGWRLVVNDGSFDLEACPEGPS
jgi:DNA invertase Pin-like site-specific DNA recombinase